MLELDYGNLGQFPDPIEAPYGIDDSMMEPHVFLALALEDDPSIRYRGIHHGITPEEGFDNAGFVKYILENSGIEVPEGVRHINEFFEAFGDIIPFGEHKSGDLVFFSGKGLRPTRMGIVLNGNQYIHSTGIDNAKVEIAWLRQEPILFQDPKRIYDVNPIGFKRIPSQTL